MPINKFNYYRRFDNLKLQIGKNFDQLNFIHPSVEGVAVEPANETPSDGTRYIVGDYNSTGKGKSGTVFENISKDYIAEYDSFLKAWTFFKPYVGMELIDKDNTVRKLKRYTSNGWEEIFDFNVSSTPLATNANFATEAGRLNSNRTFRLTGPVYGTTTSNLLNGFSIGTSLDLSSESGISGTLKIEYGGTGNSEGKVPKLDHRISIQLSGGAVGYIDFDDPNFNANNDVAEYLQANANNNGIPYSLYKIPVSGINMGFATGTLSKDHGGTGNTTGLAAGLDHSLAIVLTGAAESSLDWPNVGPDNEDFSPDLTWNATDNHNDPYAKYTINVNKLKVSDDNKNTTYVKGILPINNGGTGNSSGYAAGLDHKSKFNITGKVIGESRTTYQFIDQDPTHSGNDKSPSPIDIIISKINLGPNDSTNIEGTLSIPNGGTGNSTGNAPSAEKLDHNVKFSLSGPVYTNNSVSSNFTKTGTSTDTNISLGTSLNLSSESGISGILAREYGGTGNPNGRVLYAEDAGNAETAETATKLSKYFNVKLTSGSTDIASTQYFNGSGILNTEPSNSENLTLNVSNLSSLHYTPTTSTGTTYRRVAIDSRGHVITSGSSSSQYTKTSSFTTLSNIYDIKNANTFVCVVKTDGTITDFGNNPGYISYYTRPFIFFNDSNIYIPTSGTLMTISCNINFTGLYRTGGSVSIVVNPTQHYFDILLSNNSDLSNCMSETSTSNTNYMNLIKNTPTSTSSTFLNNCYSVFGTSNSSLSNCGINMYNMITNFLMYDGDVTQDHTGYAYYYTSIFNYSKPISKNSNIDFSKPVYGIIKISKPTTAGSNDINISWNTSSEYPAGGSSGSWDYGHVLRLVTPRIDFEYNSK